MSESERQPMIDAILKEAMRGQSRLAKQDTQEIIKEMIARKQQFFANNKRFILEYQLLDVGKEYHLSVALTLDNPLRAK